MKLRTSAAAIRKRPGRSILVSLSIC